MKVRCHLDLDAGRGGGKVLVVNPRVNHNGGSFLAAATVEGLCNMVGTEEWSGD